MTFVELFFDLVFVFALTEATALTIDHLDWEGALRSALIFLLIWATWEQWTWALNWADTEHLLARTMTLAATAVACIIAASVGRAFSDDGGLWFAIPYLIVFAGGVSLAYVTVTEHPERLRTMWWYILASVPSMVLVIVGGLVDADVRVWVWLGVILLSIGGTFVADNDEGWGLAAHFVERHALFVIIVLGESLIVIGVIVADADRTAELLRVSIGAVVVTCLLWWTYFGWLKDALEVMLEREPPSSESRLATDTFALLHMPVIGGVIGIAVGFEEIVLHPGRPLDTAGMVALALGLVLFVGGGAAVWARAGRQLLLPRLGVLTALVVALALAADAQPAVVLTIVAVAIAAIAIVEHVQHPARHILAAD